MSVTGWTHPLFTPDNVTNQPYFDADVRNALFGMGLEHGMEWI